MDGSSFFADAENHWGEGAKDENGESSDRPGAMGGDPDRQGLAVHVVGQVVSPGLYYMAPRSRIYDAIMAAEPEEDADLAKINMAMQLEDGMQIRVPAIGKPSPWGSDGLVLRGSANQENESGGESGGDGGGAAGKAAKVNINKASAKELETLPGIGPAFSQRIILYREQNGGFKTIEDLTKVKGIGQIISQDKAQFALGPISRLDFRNGINGIGNPCPLDFTIIHREPGIPGNRGAEHVQPITGGG
jgi:competence protein ComEA